MHAQTIMIIETAIMKLLQFYIKCFVMTKLQKGIDLYNVAEKKLLHD